MKDVTLPDLLLHLHTCVMLHSQIFSCCCTHAGCYASSSSLVFAHMQDAKIEDLLLHDTCRMLRCQIFICTCTHAGCYASRSSLVLAHMRDVTPIRSSPALACMGDVTLADLLLQLHTCRLLRYQIFCGTCTHCYASAGPLLHLHTCRMLR